MAGVLFLTLPLVSMQSTALMDSFMKLAKSNTDKNLETCGVLAGSLVRLWNLSLLYLMPSDVWFCYYFLQKNRKFYVTALIIPKQESTSDSVQHYSVLHSQLQLRHEPWIRHGHGYDEIHPHWHGNLERTQLMHLWKKRSKKYMRM